MLQVQLVLNNICIVCLWMQAQLFLSKNAIFIYLVIHYLILTTVFLIQTLIEHWLNYLFIIYLFIFFLIFLYSDFFFFILYFLYVFSQLIYFTFLHEINHNIFPWFYLLTWNKPQHFALICETICLQVNSEIYTVEEKNSISIYMLSF